MKRRPDITRECIIGAATQCFLRKGVSKASLADVAVLATVTRGAIYHYFAGKDELFDAVVRQVPWPLFAIAEPDDRDSLENPLDYLERSLIELMRRILSQPADRAIAEILLFKLELTNENPSLLRRMQEAQRECVRRIATLLSLAVRRDHLPAEFAVQQASSFIHASIVGVITQELFLGRQRGPFDFLKPSAAALVAAIKGDDKYRYAPPPRS
jgi:TetR/AcrR family acrAB operon transcriptional repressor